MKKKMLCLMTALVLSASAFAGCGSAPATTPPPAAPAAEAPAAETPAAEAPAPEAPAAEAPAETDSVYEAAYDYFKNFPSDKNVISSADFFASVDAGEEMFIIDIRRPDDYANGHVKDSVNLSFFDMSIPDNLDNIPDDRPVYVYCYTGQTASQTTALLNLAGKLAKNIQSGFNNGISKVESFENYIVTDATAIETGNYAVDDAMADAVRSYYADKMTRDGTPVASNNIAPADVKTIIDDGDDSYYILSVRTAEDYAKGHIETAENVPFGLGMQDGLAALPEDKIIIVYCYSGQTASQVVGVLRLMGYEAYNMSGGMGNADSQSGWLGAGFDVVAQ